MNEVYKVLSRLKHNEVVYEIDDFIRGLEENVAKELVNSGVIEKVKELATEKPQVRDVPPANTQPTEEKIVADLAASGEQNAPSTQSQAQTQTQTPSTLPPANTGNAPQ